MDEMRNDSRPDPGGIGPQAAQNASHPAGEVPGAAESPGVVSGNAAERYALKPPETSIAD